MLTDEQLAERLRAALARETAAIQPPPRLLDSIHAQLAVAQPVRPRRRWRPALATGTGAALGVAVAAAIIVLAGHRAPSPGRGAATPPATVHATHPPASTSQSVQLSIGPVARYCGGPAGALIACQPGQRPVTVAPERLVTISVVARRATGIHRWYAWSFTAPAACGGASSGGPTRSSVAAGARLAFEAVLPAGCHGTAKASVVYVRSASGADSEQIIPVGHTTATVP